MRGKEEYREQGQGREVEGEGRVEREGESREGKGRESMEGWKIKK